MQWWFACTFSRIVYCDEEKSVWVREMTRGEEQTTPVLLEANVLSLDKRGNYKPTPTPMIYHQKRGGHKHLLLLYLENTDQGERQQEDEVRPWSCSTRGPAIPYPAHGCCCCCAAVGLSMSDKVAQQKSKCQRHHGEREHFGAISSGTQHLAPTRTGRDARRVKDQTPLSCGVSGRWPSLDGFTSRHHPVLVPAAPCLIVQVTVTAVYLREKHHHHVTRDTASPPVTGPRAHTRPPTERRPFTHLPVAVADARVVYGAGPVAGARVGTAPGLGRRQEYAEGHKNAEERSRQQRPSERSHRRNRRYTVCQQALGSEMPGARACCGAQLLLGSRRFAQRRSKGGVVVSRRKHAESQGRNLDIRRHNARP